MRDCGELEGPSGGQVDLSNGTEVGSVALYSCSMGLALVGPPRTVQCLENGSWSAPPPFCEGKVPLGNSSWLGEWFKIWSLLLEVCNAYFPFKMLG